jgi:hypothetical protein
MPALFGGAILHRAIRKYSQTQADCKANLDTDLRGSSQKCFCNLKKPVKIRVREKGLCLLIATASDRKIFGIIVAGVAGECSHGTKVQAILTATE